MFDVRDNDIWWNGNIFAVIIAQGRHSLGWGAAAREALTGATVDDAEIKANIEKVFEEAADNYKPVTLTNSFIKFEEFPEGGGEYTPEEEKARNALSWHIQPAMRAQFDLVLQAHIRRFRAEVIAAFKALQDEIEDMQ